MQNKLFRKATAADIDAIAGIYNRIHDAEEAGLTTIGWIRDIYPTRATAEAALERGDLYVCEAGQILATAIINQIQVDVYADVKWTYNAPDDNVSVLHTLVVDPALRFGGIGKSFVEYWEQLAAEQGCTELRMDTNARNTIARAFYAKLGYSEVGIVPTVFNGIPGVNLVMLEKPLQRRDLNIRKIDFENSCDISELELYVGNKENHLLRYYEPEQGIFIAESRNVIELALNAEHEPISAVITDRMADDPILERLGDVPIYQVDIDEAKEYLGYILPGGICCAMRRKPATDYHEILDNARRVVVLDDVENPTNVGAIFRSAAAFGVDAILLSPACADPLYRRALRVSVGNAFLVPWTYICRSEAEWEESGIVALKKEGFRTVALALREDNINIDDERLKSEEKLALIMGNEGYGLSDRTIGACDYVAKIPMQNGVDSLNVAVAAGLAMWELTKYTEETMNRDTLAAISEYYDMKNNPMEYKRYDSFEEALEEVLNEEA